MDTKSLEKKTKKLFEVIKKYPKTIQIPKNELSKIYQDFIDTITDHNHLYYVKSNPIISDKQYDELFDYLKKLEESFPFLISATSPTQQLIGQIDQHSKHLPHKKKLLSLENSYNTEDVKDRLNRIFGQEIPNETFIVEPKFDGISVEIIYQNGNLRYGITRGDGSIGEDISNNIHTIQNLPSKLKKNLTISLRAEILMPKSVLKELNKIRAENGENLFSNTRNAAAGSIKLLDINEVRNRKLQCFVYELLRYEGEAEKIFSKLAYESQILEELKKLGLPIFGWKKIIDKPPNLLKILSTETKKELEKYDFDFDGLVIKINNLELRQKIGETAHHPKRAIAFKFPAEQAITTLKNIEFSVGRTGIITPVGILEPVKLSGAVISRVSLHNFDFIKQKNIYLQDKIWIQRSGEVIPYVISVVKDARGDDFNFEKNKISAPEYCPSCNSKIIEINGHFYCPNKECPAQIKEKILYFVSKDAMNIKGIGESFVQILLDQKMIKDIADIYKISDQNFQTILRRIPGIGNKKLNEISLELEKSKKNNFRRFLNGLGILGVGKKLAIDITTKISAEIPNTKDSTSRLNKILQLLTDETFLNNIFGIGKKTTENIIKFFKENKELIIKFHKLGYQFNFETKQKNKQNAKHFCITGTFPISREKLIKFLEGKNLIYDQNLTQNTDFLIIGKNPGSKIKKAEELGTKTITQEQLLQKYPFLKSYFTQKKINSNQQNTQKSLFE